MEHLDWVDTFFSRPSSFVFVKVSDDFLKKSLNDDSSYFRDKFDDFEAAKRLILTNFSANDNIQQQAEALYGLIHARYLNTAEGAEKMAQKQKSKVFPHCPRVFCQKMTCVPYGITEELHDKTVKMFCPNCKEFYNVNDERIAKIDGAFFGPSWVQVLLKAHKELELPDKPEYIPRIFGFKIYQPPDAQQRQPHHENEQPHTK